MTNEKKIILEQCWNYINADPRIISLLNNCELIEVREENKNLVLFMQLTNLFSIKDYKFIYNYFQQKKINDQHYQRIELQFENSILVEDLGLIKEYLKFLAESIGQEKFRQLVLNSFDAFQKDFSLSLIIDDKTYKFYENYFTKLVVALKQAGIKNIINYELAENNHLEVGEKELIKKIQAQETEVKEEVIVEKKPIKNGLMKISEIEIESRDVTFIGKVFEIEVKLNSRKKLMANISLTDEESSIRVLAIESANIGPTLLNSIEENHLLEVQGAYRADTYRDGHTFFVQKITIMDKVEDKFSDDAKEKRVELHLHSNMSTMDGVNKIEDYIKAATMMGHQALAITDHSAVQAFPAAQKAVGKKGLKMIYGVEANMIEPIPLPLINESDKDLSDAVYVIFDIETTGLSPEQDDIIEIGAIKVHRNIEEDQFQSFVHIDYSLSEFTKNLTRISDADLVDAPDLESVLDKFIKFIDGAVLVAHNARFDYNFIQTKLAKLGKKKITNPVIDTLNLAKRIFTTLGYYRLESLAKYCQIVYNEEKAHRAIEDAIVLSKVYERLLKESLDAGAKNINDLNKLTLDDNYRKVYPYHIVILAKNQQGLKNLFKLVSLSNVKYFAQQPRIPRSEIIAHREGLLLGSSCLNGEIFDLAQTATDEKLEQALKFYDYIEIQPYQNYKVPLFLGKLSEEQLLKILKKIIEKAKKLNIPIVATGDVHNLRKEDVKIRDIYVNTLAVGNTSHPLFDYKGRIKEIPNNYFLSTQEMMDALTYVDEKDKYEFVVTNSNMIANMCEAIYPVRDHLSPPHIANSDELIKNIIFENAKKKYGPVLPDIVQRRIDKELSSIIQHRFSVIYYSAYLLVKKSLEEEYLVGSRGSVGSSLVATLMGITEVNPLAPHYACENCYYFELKNIRDGYDLPTIVCPKCGHLINADGHDIPFETFLGFEGEKVPDIDLNFSGDYQAKAHDYTKKIFGTDKVFRAGTISTIADKKAFGYVRAYFEKKGLNHMLDNNTHIAYIAKKCTGVKLTTGQHPGGIIVIPQDMEVEDFTPIQYPADKVDDWYTTHIDFDSLHDTVLKLDILGHVDPTVLKMLHELTGINPRTITLNDPKIYELFTSTKPIGLQAEDVPNWPIGIAGLPEFGTQFVRKMVLEVKPRTFADLLKISGLSHGTNVWQDNLRDIFLSSLGVKIDEIIGCRDDIMIYLINKGVAPSMAFEIMEIVRKGRGEKQLNQEKLDAMRQADVPEWYINSCIKIKYLFPKAHATAYVMMALRIAWYKIYYPLAYYASYFSFRIEHFDIQTLVKGKETIEYEHNNITKKGKGATDKELALLNTYEIALEMINRGYRFANIDINKSEATKFLIADDGLSIIPSFTSVEGLGAILANKIVEERQKRLFDDKRDFLDRVSINNTLLKYFVENKILSEESTDLQLSFDI